MSCQLLHRRKLVLGFVLLVSQEYFQCFFFYIVVVEDLLDCS